ncbi:MAG: RidA family protein [Nitrospinae bacterium]|nr:RidA family protein [Nitrospinota bacterium]
MKRKAAKTAKKKIVKRKVGKAAKSVKKVIISSPDAPAAIGPYSQGVRAGNTVYFSGQIPLDPATGELVPGGIREQTERVLRNVSALVKAAGATLDNVVKSTVYLVDLGMFAEMNAVYSQFFKADHPGRVTIQVAGLPKNSLVEIDVVVVL